MLNSSTSTCHQLTPPVTQEVRRQLPRKGRRKKAAKNDDGGDYCIPQYKRNDIESGTMVKCHMCQMWVHPECVGEVEKEIVTFWCCQTCRPMSTLVEKILPKVTALEHLEQRWSNLTNNFSRWSRSNACRISRTGTEQSIL